MPSGSCSNADLELAIDLEVVADNWRQLKNRLKPGTECAAVLKADAYGLGAAAVAPKLADAGCRTFFAATIDEGIALRSLVPEASVFVLCGPNKGGVHPFREHRLIPVLNDPSQIAFWRQNAPAAPAAIHLDTGMTRLGLCDSDLCRLGDMRPVVVMSHLACADTPDHPMNEIQRSRFDAMRARLSPCPASLAASSGIFLGSGYHFDLVRPGAALYGLAPSAGFNPMGNPLHLRARILQSRTIDTPGTVGYGATFETKRGQRLLTLGVGYADGFPRRLGNRGAVFLNGYRLPVVGRVSMDLTVCDATNAPEDLCHPGGWVDIIGPDQSADALAGEADTIGYEILTNLSRRCRRIYLNQPTSGR